MKYTVRSGDTLSKIAARLLGDASLYTDIAERNQLDDPNAIFVGQELEIDAPEAPAQGAVQADGENVVLTREALADIAPQASAENLDKYLGPLNEVLPTFDINTPLRVAHFLAQVGHESGAFRFVSENLNYSAKALRAVFGKYFTSDEMAEEYARKPEQIANVVYADRMGNGDTDSGDGWRYRGRGLIQLTGKDNYQAMSDAVGKDLVSDPDQVADDPALTIASACWYWQSRKLNEYADQDDIRAVTRRVNGGYHGLQDREAYLERAKNALQIS